MITPDGAKTAANPWDWSRDYDDQLDELDDDMSRVTSSADITQLNDRGTPPAADDSGSESESETDDSLEIRKSEMATAYIMAIDTPASTRNCADDTAGRKKRHITGTRT